MAHMLRDFDSLYEKVESGCWEWFGAIDPSGYGTHGRSPGKECRAHRIAYIRAKGEIPEGLVVRHTCDNRRCVNPDHLLVGTKTDNANDRTARRRTGNLGKFGPANHCWGRVQSQEEKDKRLASRAKSRALGGK